MHSSGIWIGAPAWYHALATWLLLWFRKRVFALIHRLNSSSVCSPIERSPLSTLMSSKCRWHRYFGSQSPGQTWPGLEKSTCSGKPSTVSAFPTAKKLPTKSCPLQSTLQESSLSRLSRSTKYVLKGLLCERVGAVNRCSAHFNFPLASLRHHSSPSILNAGLALFTNE